MKPPGTLTLRLMAEKKETALHQMMQDTDFRFHCLHYCAEGSGSNRNLSSLAYFLFPQLKGFLGKQKYI